jgi:hypothetical protein
MGCNHKFYEYLNLEKINFKPQLLIIGTFNPEWPEGNYAEWFYGRTGNNYFWEILPRMFQEESLRDSPPDDWKSFCSEKRIAITDLIASIRDAEPNNPNHFDVISKFKDTEFAATFNDFEITDILGILNNNPTIEKVFFTRNAGVNLFDDEINPISTFCENNNIHFSHLLTPSGNARFQMGGYEPQDPNLERNLPNFIYENWLENWGE